jgi:hypothetical protein
MNPLKYVIATAGIVAFAGLSSASASVVYNGGSPDQGGDIYSYPPFEAEMSFTLTSAATITGANWWGDCYPATTCGSLSFQIAVSTNNSGTPGTVLDSIPVGSGNQTATGQLVTGGYDEYAYSAGFAPFMLAAGTYFFNVEAAEGPWGWETTSSAPAGAQLQEYFDMSYQSLPEQLAFQLTSSPTATPLPAALPLFATGLGVLSLLGWRRKRNAQTLRV